MGRGDLSDAEWERLRPFLPVSNGRCGRWRDHRQVIDGILHRVRTGVQWRDLPERFGPRKTVYERHRLWSADGTWERLLQQVQAAADAAGEIDWDVGRLDHRAGASACDRRPHRPTAGPRLQGGGSPRTPGRKAVAEPARPPGGGGAGGEGLGRSRGRLHHQTPPERGRPLPPGVLDRHTRPAGGLHTVQTGAGEDPCPEARAGQASTRSRTASLPTRHTATDRAASTCGTGASGTRSRRRPTARPPRLRKDSRGGEPPGFNEDRYTTRNTAERAINRLKQH
ncbi:transposase [Streptomyces tibetensis]|uniref:transposase n=1 Tax=Streptomyces tibetensis TaxID=2382123 RepID=UPI003F4D1E7B